MLKLEKLNNEIVLDINGEEVNVKTTIPVLRRSSIIEVALRDSVTEDSARPSKVLFDAILCTLIVLEYTDLEIENMATTNIFDLYDILDSNKIIEKVLLAIESNNEKEISSLIDYSEKAYNEFINQLNSAGTAVTSLITGFLEAGAIAAASHQTMQNTQNKEDKIEE